MTPRVRIVCAGLPSYWYASRIHHVFEVVSVLTGIQKYEVWISQDRTGYVDFQDAVPEPLQLPVTSSLHRK